MLLIQQLRGKNYLHYKNTLVFKDESVPFGATPFVNGGMRGGFPGSD